MNDNTKAAPQSMTCDHPPMGYRCTRSKGHDGPCACIRIGSEADALQAQYDEGYQAGFNAALAQTGQAPAPKCSGCNGHGMVGGLRPDGYDAEECPFCKGTGAEAAPAGAEPVISMKRSEWTSLSPEAQQKLMQITGAGSRALRLADAQAAQDMKHRVLLLRQAAPASEPETCSSCEGSGQEPAPYEGYWSSKKYPCQDCDGTGAAAPRMGAAVTDAGSERYSFVCNGGCGVCAVKVRPFERERTETLQGEHLGSVFIPQIVSSCCGAEVHVYDNEADKWGAEVTLAALAGSATPEAEPTEFQVVAMTTAYEQGVGKGHHARLHGTVHRNPYAPEWGCRRAWELGYDQGKSTSLPAASAGDALTEDARDAARYRWLRNERRSASMGMAPYVGIDNSDDYPKRWALSGADADRAIDQAMKDAALSPSASKDGGEG